MSDPVVERWNQRGSFYLWRFPGESRNYPGWHCAADVDGRSSVLELLSLMGGARWGSRTEIAVSAPPHAIASIPGNPRNDRRHSPASLVVRYPKDRCPDDLWQWSGDLRNPVLSVGRSKLDELNRAFEMLDAGIGDFCVHADDQKLHGFEFERMSICFWALH